MKNVFIPILAGSCLVAANQFSYGVNVYLDYEDDKSSGRTIYVDFRAPYGISEDLFKERKTKLNARKATYFNDTNEPERDFFKSNHSVVFTTFIEQSKELGSLMFFGIDGDGELASVKSALDLLGSKTNLHNKFKTLSITFDGSKTAEAKAAADSKLSVLKSQGNVGW